MYTLLSELYALQQLRTYKRQCAVRLRVSWKKKKKKKKNKKKKKKKRRRKRRRSRRNSEPGDYCLLLQPRLVGVLQGLQAASESQFAFFHAPP